MKQKDLNQMAKISAGTTPRQCFFAPFRLLISYNSVPSLIYSLTLINYCYNY